MVLALDYVLNVKLQNHRQSSYLQMTTVKLVNLLKSKVFFFVSNIINIVIILNHIKMNLCIKVIF